MIFFCPKADHDYVPLTCHFTCFGGLLIRPLQVQTLPSQTPNSYCLFSAFVHVWFILSTPSLFFLSSLWECQKALCWACPACGLFIGSVLIYLEWSNYKWNMIKLWFNCVLHYITLLLYTISSNMARTSKRLRIGVASCHGTHVEVVQIY